MKILFSGATLVVVNIFMMEFISWCLSIMRMRESNQHLVLKTESKETKLHFMNQHTSLTTLCIPWWRLSQGRERDQTIDNISFYCVGIWMILRDFLCLLFEFQNCNYMNFSKVFSFSGLLLTLRVYGKKLLVKEWLVDFIEFLFTPIWYYLFVEID